jgi:predicted  nucleic acid-binding Zn-ribbon protein
MKKDDKKTDSDIDKRAEELQQELNALHSSLLQSRNDLDEIDHGVDREIASLEGAEKDLYEYGEEKMGELNNAVDNLLEE